MVKKPEVNLNAMTPAEAARMFTSMARFATKVQQIEAALSDGAPTNDDGTINALHFVAWLIKDAQE